MSGTVHVQDKDAEKLESEEFEDRSVHSNAWSKQLLTWGVEARGMELLQCLGRG